MQDFIQDLTQVEQVLLILAAFFAIWFLSNVAAVIARGGSAPIWTGAVATLLVIAVVLI